MDAFLEEGGSCAVMVYVMHWTWILCIYMYIYALNKQTSMLILFFCINCHVVKDII